MKDTTEVTLPPLPAGIETLDPELAHELLLLLVRRDLEALRVEARMEGTGVPPESLQRVARALDVLASEAGQ